MFWQALKTRLLAPEKLAEYAVKAIHLVLIIVAAWLVYFVVARIMRRVVEKGGARERRARTLVSLIQSILGYSILFVAIILCLRTLGVDYAAILAGAGVIGLAVGFGAQTLVRDFISGFFILFEDLISVGDYVTVGDIAGTVEKVGFRATQLRGFDGVLHVVPNGELTKFGNANRGFTRALVTVDIAYEQDVEKSLAVARTAAERWYESFQDIALEPPVVQGIVAFGDSGMRIRVVAKVRPMQHWEAERSLRLALKQAFDAAGIEIPFPRRVVYSK
ncbi:MAG: mechanosensitive ion channel family protein [candidate division WOR-3 bacterium]